MGVKTQHDKELSDTQSVSFTHALQGVVRIQIVCYENLQYAINK